MSTRTSDGPGQVQAGKPRWRSMAMGAALAVAVLVAAGRLDILPSIGNPFGTTTIDRSQPVLVESLEDISRYQAATANFQVVIDNEKDTRFVPSAIKGERTLYVAAGSVDATVDFSALDERSVKVLPDGSVTVVLPSPQLSPARVDPAQSRVVSRDRGLLDRVGSVFADTPTSERPLVMAAVDKMNAAAAASDLRERAERNTRTMLQGLLVSLGYDRVSVTFAPSPT